jgi:DNA-directed RNA polymerase
MLEYQRMKLLRSSDPDEVELGKKMVTPASLFEEMASDTDILKDGLDDLGLGDISSHETQSKSGQDQRVVDDSVLEDTDDSLTGLTSAESTESCVDEDPDELVQLSAFEKRLQPGKKTKKAAEAAQGSIDLWLPMSFPPVPKKVRS